MKIEQGRDAAGLAEQTRDPMTSGAKTGRAGLRGLTYDEQVRVLTPAGQGTPPGDGAAGTSTRAGTTPVTVGEGAVADPSLDGGAGEVDRVGPKKGRERLDAILGSDSAPLSDADLAEAERLVPHLSRKVRPLYRDRLDDRIASGRAERELEALLEGLTTPITGDASAQAQALLDGPVAGDRRAAWQAKLDAAIAWGAVDQQLSALFTGLDGPMPEESIAGVEALITQLPPGQRAAWGERLASQRENDRLEGELEALIGQDDRLSDAERDTARGLIATLTNGRAEHWSGELAARIEVDDTKHTFYESQRDNATQKGVGGDVQCNVTSVAMQLLQLAGSREHANAKAVELLASKGDTRWQKQVERHEVALADLQLEDLLLARIQLTPKAEWDKRTWEGIRDTAPQERAVVLNAVTAEFIAMGIVERTDYAEKGAKQSGEDFFSGLRKDKLAGKNWTSSIGTGITPGGHVVNLVDVLDDGVVVNDPYGLALAKGAYIKNEVTVARTQLGDRRDIAERRTRFNGRVKDLLLGTAPSEAVETAWGALNFYDWAEVETLSIGQWANMAYGKDEDREEGGKYASNAR